MWISRAAEIWNAAIKAQQVRQAGTSYAEQVFEGWFVPDYAAEKWPDITTVEGLKAHAAAMGNGGRPRFLSCPLDWGCNIVNRNMLRAQGLDQVFEIVEPANRFELDTLIAEAVGRNEPIVFYYWQPNAILPQFAFREIALGAYNKDNCLPWPHRLRHPLPTGFAPDPVIVALSEWVYVDARRSPPISSAPRCLRRDERHAAAAQRARRHRRDRRARFIAERGEVWRPWAGLAADGQAAAPAEEAPAQTTSRPQRQPAPRQPEPEPPAPTPPRDPPPSLL